MPLRLIPKGTVVSVLSGVNRGCKWIVGSASTHSSWIGTFEAARASDLQKLIQPGTIAYDLGANVGYYTLALSSLVGHTGHVFAFEPEARNVDFLRRHIKLNNLRNVTVIQAAVSNSRDLISFEGSRESGRIGAGGSYRIPSISLDEFMTAGNPEPSFIKMDIEGAERLALDGARVILTKATALWMVGTHSPQLRADCREIFRNHGYKIVKDSSRRDPGESNEFLALPNSD
jgi:FkbM family methyltransferase